MPCHGEPGAQPVQIKNQGSICGTGLGEFVFAQSIEHYSLMLLAASANQNLY